MEVYFDYRYCDSLPSLHISAATVTRVCLQLGNRPSLCMVKITGMCSYTDAAGLGNITILLSVIHNN